MPTLAIGALALLGLTTTAAVLAWKRRQGQQWFAAGNVLPSASKSAPGSTWQPTYATAEYPAEAINPSMPGKAAYILPRGRLVRGIEMNRVTQDGTVTPHWGIDLSAPIGMPVYAAKSGTVTRAEPITGYGNAIVVRHDDGRQSTLYGHLSRMIARQGMSVHGGQVIGEVGNSTAGPDGVVPTWGRSMASHLHLEVHPTPTPVLTRMAQRLDPVRWLQDEGIDQYESRA